MRGQHRADGVEIQRVAPGAGDVGDKDRVGEAVARAWKFRLLHTAHALAMADPGEGQQQAVTRPVLGVPRLDQHAVIAVKLAHPRYTLGRCISQRRCAEIIGHSVFRIE